MKEYIEREAAYEMLSEYYHHSTEIQHEALREALSRVPAADVRPVLRGRWEIKGEFANCTVCKEGLRIECDIELIELFDGMPHFCPNCGAYMRGEN